MQDKIQSEPLILNPKYMLIVC